MVEKEEICATIDRIDERIGLIHLQSPDGKKFSVHRVMLMACGFDCADTLRVGDRVSVVVSRIVTYQVEEITDVAPGELPAGTLR